MASRSVYVSEMLKLGHGIPLWSPSPTESGEVLIGDVGRIKNGAFYRLFNATHHADHELNKHYGVPDGFEMLTYNKDLQQKLQNHVPATLYSDRVVRIAARARASSAFPSMYVDGQYFSVRKRGAVLVMRDQGCLVEVDATKAFVAYAQRHRKSWIAFVQKLGLDLKTASDDNSIILVRGFVKTTGWSMGTYARREQTGSIELDASAFAGVETHASLWCMERRTKKSERHSGPAFRSIRSLFRMKKFDQCVFVLGVRCKSSGMGRIDISTVP